MLRAAVTLEDRSAAPDPHPHLAELAETGACRHHPDGHDRVVSQVQYPDDSFSEMLVFDAAAYFDTPGYCPGDDDVSRTILRRGQWEPMETRTFYKALRRRPGIVIDFGGQIGWYTTFAVRLGRPVLCIEPIREHVHLIRENVAWQGGRDSVVFAQTWIDRSTKTIEYKAGDPEVALVKIDLEGNDLFALRALEMMLLVTKPDVLCEISPVFNDSYVELLAWMKFFGYKAAIVNPWQIITGREPWDVITEIKNDAGQVDIIFTTGNLEELQP